LPDLAGALLRPFAQIVLSRDLRTGALVLVAIAMFPKLALAALAAVAVAAMVTLAFGLGPHAVVEGGYGCTAVLTALALGVYPPSGGDPRLLVVAGAALAVLLTASFEAVFSTASLPAHSLPFVAATWLVHLASRSLPAPASFEPWTVGAAIVPAAWLGESWLDVPASLLFLHGRATACLVLAAILLHSRIAVVLAFVGALGALGARAALRAEMPWSAIDTTAAFNGMLAAMALGGVWFVPHASSIVLAGAAGVATAVVAYALGPAASIAELPVVSLPFVVTTHLVLTASRRRLQDRWPRSALPAARPEEALARELVRVRRFGDSIWLPFRLPVRGEWVVTQGYDGKHTHKGPWRHALDFEVQGDDGKVFERSGQQAQDFRCFGLPVLAAGAGTVALVVDAIADNRPGEMNVKDNWGNAVVIAHAAGLYSVYAHLQMRSIRVKVGDSVASGAEIARCGCSGRASTPHLHFQVQRAATLGSPTIPADFGDVVVRDDGAERLLTRVVPGAGTRVRAVVRDDAVARALGFAPGTTLRLQEEDGGATEDTAVEIDLWGRTVLRSERAALVLEPYESGLVVVDFHGHPRSLLRYLLVGLARIPYDQSATLTWSDTLPLRVLLPGWLRAVADLVAVVAPSFGSARITYRADREEGDLHVRGEAGRWSSHALVRLGMGLQRVSLEDRGKRSAIAVRAVSANGEVKA
jgi:murein DD-endopeptidase MepM/ murein hydrolase activator NlpD